MAMLLVVVARHRLDRYEDLRRRFEDSNNVRIVLDRPEGERRRQSGIFIGVDRRSPIDRRQYFDSDAFMRLGWFVIETGER
jgi:hypothetical protein